MNLDEQQNSFVGHLLSLAEEGREDRGALADLRSGLGKSPGEMARVHKYVVPYLPSERYNDRWLYILASLFGFHPKHKKPVYHENNGKKWTEVWTVGRAFRPLAFPPPPEPKKQSMEARFVALLNAHPDDLADHLRHTVSLLKSSDPPQPLDWFQLLRDLLQWDHPERRVQLRWARDFYAGAGTTATSSETPNQEEEQ